MKGYTIQNSIDLLEKNSGGSAGASTAADVSYDNTSSHLTADDVQEAIDELNTAIGQIGGVEYSTMERKIGKVGNDDLYQIMLDTGALPNSTKKSVAHGITNLKQLYKFSGMAKNTTSGEFVPFPMCFSHDSVTANIVITVDATNVNLDTGTNLSVFAESFVIMEYTKTSTQTRKKK